MVALTVLDHDVPQHTCQRAALGQDQRRSLVPGIELDVGQLREHALLDTGIAGIVVERAGLVDDPGPGDATIFAEIDESIVEILIGSPSAGALLAQLPPLNQLVVQEPGIGRNGAVAFMLLQQIEQ